ncbi:hypothetical protein BGX21_006496 [Mortierella sp. AD011]|nr:hypothetical protein BGX20_006437 [Mortierella sp. AD010]KAF9399291.1 hypothetical protein BGX21_006496 [Mortierella sp. AD011]
MDKILESFRKLREGLFATETRDIFAAEVYQQSVLSSLYAGNIPELTKALYHLVQEIHPVVYKQTGATSIPIERQRFLGLYILHNFAKPMKGNDPQSLAIAKPRTETDRLVVSLLNTYEQHQRCVLSNSSQSQVETGGARSSILGPELLFPLAYWKSLRDGNWIRRERLLSQTQPKNTASWEQRLMIRHAMGDPLRSARTLTVATMSKAYYSLPITAVARSVGLTELHGDLQATEADGVNSQLHKNLQSSYGLATSIIMRDGQLLFKAKS